MRAFFFAAACALCACSISTDNDGVLVEDPQDPKTMGEALSLAAKLRPIQMERNTIYTIVAFRGETLVVWDPTRYNWLLHVRVNPVCNGSRFGGARGVARRSNGECRWE